MSSADALLDKAFTDLLDKLLAPGATQQTRTTRVVNIPFVVGLLGTPLAGGELLWLRLGLNASVTLVEWSLAATIGDIPTASNCTVDVQIGPSLAAVASICGGAPPHLAAQSELNDQPPGATWATSIPDHSTVAMRVLAVDGLVEQIGLTLRVSVVDDPLASVVTDSSGDVVVDNNGVPLTWG